MTASNKPVVVDKYPEITAFIEAQKLTIKYTFIPSSQSRHRNEKLHSLNWLFSLYKSEKLICQGDYGQGQAHTKSYEIKCGPYPLMVQHQKQGYINKECETGFYVCPKTHMTRHTPIPQLRDVLYALSVDSSFFGSFEDWCGDFGFDTDSQKALKMYEACMKTRHKLLEAFGTQGFETLVALFQDY